MGFAIYEVPVGAGVVAICPLPKAAQDFQMITDWAPQMVVSLTQDHEGDVSGLQGFAWHHAPVVDFGVPTKGALDDIIAQAIAVIADGGRVLFHCKGGCGRSGMAALRVMHLMQVPDPLAVLRAVRPCAVETQDQLDWAIR